MNVGLEVKDLGLVDYDVAYRLQREAVEARREVLMLLEHPDVYTVGRKFKAPLLLAGAKVVEVERGGEVTYHNPGQLVAYPIVRVTDLHRYLRQLEDVLIETVAELGVPAERREGATGVWVGGGKRKIASIGVAVSRWMAYHGVALNVSNDLAGFARISPCGFEASVMTSLEKELGRPVVMSEVKRVFARWFDRIVGTYGKETGKSVHRETAA